MTLIIIIVVLVLIFGGGGFYGHRQGLLWRPRSQPDLDRVPQPRQSRNGPTAERSSPYEGCRPVSQNRLIAWIKTGLTIGPWLTSTRPISPSW
jgi:hypothetical protein